ncbi:hypothetical protein VST7929_02910 [Vibrio stylophorae]|uniref:Transposase n=1 Tax=Vibrio stylophorae TaxID=659351 RepID=A0ABN8DXA9_9VIBR|nr:hypothetical protein VST7929_02910 [Vibrio stylophorae]
MPECGCCLSLKAIMPTFQRKLASGNHHQSAFNLRNLACAALKYIHISKNSKKKAHSMMG